MNRMGAIWRRWINYLVGLADTVDENGRGVGERLFLVIICLPVVITFGIGWVRAHFAAHVAALALVLDGLATVLMTVGTVFIFVSCLVAFSELSKKRKQYRLVAATQLTGAINRLGAALEESQALFAVASAEAESRQAELIKLRDSVQRTALLDSITPEQAAAIRAEVKGEFDRTSTHLDRMGWLFAATGWVVAVAVVVFDHFIPRLGG